MLYIDNGNHLMFSIFYMIYIMTLNLPTTQLSFITISIQKQLLKNFPLQDRKMKVYTIRFQKIHETCWHSIMLLVF